MNRNKLDSIHLPRDCSILKKAKNVIFVRWRVYVNWGLKGYYIISLISASYGQYFPSSDLIMAVDLRSYALLYSY